MPKSRLAHLIREEAQAVRIRRDLAGEYAQVAVFAIDARTGELWITAATFELHLVLSLAQIALLARDSTSTALGPVNHADIQECWKPRVADRLAQPLDDAFAAVVEAMEAYKAAAAAN